MDSTLEPNPGPKRDGGSKRRRPTVRQVLRVDSEAEQKYDLPPTATPIIPENFRQSGSNTDEDEEFQDSILEEPKAGTSNGQFAKGGGHSGAGLRYLTSIDHIFIKQKTELSETIFGCERNNKYKITNVKGHIIYTAEENTNCCARNCCGSLRSFDIMMKDKDKNDVIRLSRPCACNSCICPCLLQSIKVYSPPDVLVGRVDQDWTFLKPTFTVKDGKGETVLRINGPTCTCSTCGNVEFKILSKDGTTERGKISKEWSGVVEETLTNSDTFGLNFPGDLDVKIKALLIGTSFLLDFMYFGK